MTQIAKLDLKTFFFIVILIVVGGVLLQVFAPFVHVIVLALVIVQLFYPLYKILHKLVRHAGLASLLTTLITLITVILPLIGVGVLAAAEISNTLTNLDGTINAGPTPLYQDQVLREDGTVLSTLREGRPTLLDTGIAQLESNVNALIADISDRAHSAGIQADIAPLNMAAAVKNFLAGLQANLLPFAGGLISLSINLLFTAFIFIITLLYLFTSYHRLPQMLRKISPLDDELDNLLLRNFKDTNRAVIAGSFVVAIAQASAVSIVLVLLGVGAPVLLWILMVFLSLIPVGSGLVWFPVGLALIMSGQPLVGIALIIYSGITINVIDAVLRPIVLKGAVHLHPLIIIFSALGGINLFGPLGILYGPLVAVFFTSLMGVYNQRFGNRAVISAENN